MAGQMDQAGGQENWRKGPECNLWAGAWDFFTPIGRNPLKSPNSKK